MQNEPPSSQNTSIEDMLRQVRDAPASSSSPSRTPSSFDNPSFHNPNLLNTPFSFRFTIRLWLLILFVLIVLIGGILLGKSFSFSGTQSQSVSPNTNNPTFQSIAENTFAAGQTWQGEYNQNDSYASGSSPSVLKIDSIQGTTFLGSYTNFNNDSNVPQATVAISGEIIHNINDISDTTEKGRLEEVINRYGSKGFLIKYTDTTLLQGNGIQLNVDDYALVGDDGTIKGIWYYFPSVSVPDGDFFYHKTA